LKQGLLNALENIEPDQLPSQDRSEAKDIGGEQIIPSENPKGNEIVILKPVEEEHPYNLTYTCLLIPKIYSPILTEDVSNGLQGRMKQICNSFGWHLEYLSVMPEYIQWIMHVPPTASTVQFMQVIREQTSQYLFAEFPHFSKQNLSTDFWAPGYLIFWGSQQHPHEIIQKYIQQTRQQQDGTAG